MKQMTNEDMANLIHRIAAPTFKYMMKRINNEVLKASDMKDMPLNVFLNVILTSMASVDANSLRWLQGFHKIKTNSEIDFDSLKWGFFGRLEEHLGVLKR